MLDVCSSQSLLKQGHSATARVVEWGGSKSLNPFSNRDTLQRKVFISITPKIDRLNPFSNRDTLQQLTMNNTHATNVSIPSQTGTLCNPNTKFNPTLINNIERQKTITFKRQKTVDLKLYIFYTSNLSTSKPIPLPNNPTTQQQQNQRHNRWHRLNKQRFSCHSKRPKNTSYCNKQ